MGQVTKVSENVSKARGASGLNHTDFVVEVMANNANAERTRGRFLEANILYKRSIELIVGQNFSDKKSRILGELAFSYLLMGDFENSYKLERKHLSMIEKEYKKVLRSESIDHRLLSFEYLLSLSKLSTLSLMIGRFDRANLILGRLVKQSNSYYGEDSKILVACLNLLGHVKHRLGLNLEAESYFRQSLDLQADQLMIENGKEASICQSAIDTLKGLGTSLCAQGNERHGQLYCSVAVAEQRKLKQNVTISNELSEMVQDFCIGDEFDYIKPICDLSQDISIFPEACDLAGLLSTFSRIVKNLVPEFRTDEIDLRIEMLMMAS